MRFKKIPKQSSTDAHMDFQLDAEFVACLKNIIFHYISRQLGNRP